MTQMMKRRGASPGLNPSVALTETRNGERVPESKDERLRRPCGQSSPTVRSDDKARRASNLSPGGAAAFSPGRKPRVGAVPHPQPRRGGSRVESPRFPDFAAAPPGLRFSCSATRGLRPGLNAAAPSGGSRGTLQCNAGVKSAPLQNAWSSTFRNTASGLQGGRGRFTSPRTHALGYRMTAAWLNS